MEWCGDAEQRKSRQNLQRRITSRSFGNRQTVGVGVVNAVDVINIIGTRSGKWCFGDGSCGLILHPVHFVIAGEPVPKQMIVFLAEYHVAYVMQYSVENSEDS